MTDLSISTNFVESASIDEPREIGLLRQAIEPLIDPESPLTYGVVSDHGRNVSNVIFETRSALHQRYRDLVDAKASLFESQITSKEGNAKYVCKRLKGQQPLVVGNIE
ncbi:hypothetical protein PI125_g22188 [Phytophthora idaei]|nr:hypothetical protein PI125_g22188 [Phytophthora idaei]KAG3130582.1 hypothetical protein PI126_g20437 [Phytophthora idaei]